MTNQQLNFFKTYSTGLIDSVLIKTEAKGYVKPVGKEYTRDEFHCDWKYANNPQTGENYDIESQPNTYDRVARNHKIIEANKMRSGYGDRGRDSGNVTEPIDTFLRTWLETKDDTIFNTRPGEEVELNFEKEYPLPFKDGKTIVALLLFKWVNLKCRIAGGTVNITSDDLNDIGNNITLVDLSKLLRSYFDKSLIKNWYDKETKTLTIQTGGRDQRVSEGPGYITFDLGPKQLEFAEKLVKNITK
jgi:hypothetical protein